MRYNIVETVPANGLPVLLADMKNYLKLENSDDDFLVLDFIRAATEHAEKFTGRSFVKRTYKLYMDCWPCSGVDEWWDGVREGAFIQDPVRAIGMPKLPLLSVAAIKVYDENDDSTTFEDYHVDTAGGRIALKTGATPPITTKAINGIEIEFSVGYTTLNQIPSIITMAIRKLVAFMYENRGDGVEEAAKTSGAEKLLRQYRILKV